MGGTTRRSDLNDLTLGRVGVGGIGIMHTRTVAALRQDLQAQGIRLRLYEYESGGSSSS